MLKNVQNCAKKLKCLEFFDLYLSRHPPNSVKPYRYRFWLSKGCHCHCKISSIIRMYHVNALSLSMAYHNYMYINYRIYKKITGDHLDGIGLKLAIYAKKKSTFVHEYL